MVDHPRKCRPNTEARVLIPDTLWRPEEPIAQRVDRNTTTGSAIERLTSDRRLTPTGTFPDGDNVLNASTAFRI
jgi:hypothetical protein